MSIALITGSCGLVGSESANFFIEKGLVVIGLDNNLRKFFFGKDGSTLWIKNKLLKLNKNYIHYNTDIRNYSNVEKIFKKVQRRNKSYYSLCSSTITRFCKKSSKIRF